MSDTTSTSISIGTAVSLDGLQEGISSIEANIAAMEGRLNSRISGLGNAVGKMSEDAEAQIGRISDAGGSLGDVFNIAARAAASIGVAFTAQSLVSQIMNVRGEFQKLEVAFNTMLGSEEKANELMKQLIQTAATTPFDLNAVANGAKQLLAYGEDVKNVNEDLIRLGNIAAGLSIPLNDIVYLYGTTMTQGRLYTQDLNQFTGRGIPMIGELANVMGVAEEKVRGLVEEGKIGFPEVQEAIRNMTNEGGMFYNLMQEQSKTISGQIANIEDAISVMLNEIGQQSEGVINGALGVVSSLVENYQQVGRVLLALVATYGVYRTACMIVTAALALQKAGIASLTVAESIHYGLLVLLKKAQALLNATMLANPYVLVATLVAGLVAVMWSMHDSTTAADAAQKDMNDTMQRAKEKQEEYNRETENAINKAKDEAASTDDRRAAMNMLIQRYPSIIKKYIDEEGHLKNIAKLKREIAELDGKKTTANLKKEADNNQSRLDFLKKLRSDYGEHVNSGYLKNKGLDGAAKWLLSLSEQARKAMGKTFSPTMQELIDFYGKKTDLSRTAANRNVTENRIKAFQESISKMTSDQLDALIKELGRAESRVNGHKSAYVNSVKDYLTRNDIENLMTTAEGVKNARANTTHDYDYWEKIYKEAESQKKALDISQRGSREWNRLEEKAREAKAKMDSYNSARSDNRGKSSEGRDESEEKDKREAEARKERQQRLGKELVQIEQETQQAEIDAMDEGTAKKLAVIELDYNRQKNKLEQQKADWIRENQKAGLTTEGDGLTKEQSNALKAANEQNENRYNKLKERARKEEADMQQEAMNNYYIQYGTMQEKILALTKQYVQKRENAKTEGERLTLQKEMDNELKRIKLEDFKKSLDWDTVFGNLGMQSLSSLYATLDKLRSKFGEMKDSMSVSDIKDVQEAMAKLENEIASRNPFTALSKSFKDISKYKNELVSALNDYAAAQKEVTAAQKEYNAAVEARRLLDAQVDQGTLTQNSEEYKKALEAVGSAEDKLVKAREKSNNAEKSAINARNNITVSYKNFASQLGKVGGVIKDIGGKAKNLAAIFSDNVAGSIEKSIDFMTEMMDAAANVIDAIGDTGKNVANAMSQTAQATGTAVRGTATATAASISTVEKASVILAVISAALQVATAIANLFNDDEAKQKEIERLQERIDQLQWELDNAESMRMQKRTGDAVERLRAIYAEAYGEIERLHEREINSGNRIQGIILRNIVANKAYSESVKRIADYYADLDYTADKALGEERYENAREQIENLAEQQVLLMRQVDEENSRKKTDSGTVADLENRIRENAEKMASVINEMMEDIIGSTAEDLASNLGDAFFEAFKNGEDAAKAWGDKVNEIVADILKKMMIQQFLEKPIGKLFNKYKEKWFGKDGTQFSIDAVKNSLGDFSNELNGLVSKMQEAFGELPDDLKDMLTGDAEREGTSKGIATASQDSVDENNARLTTIQGHTYSINQGVTELNRTGNAMLIKLTAIEGNTARTNDKLDTMNVNIRNIRGYVDDIQAKGIRLRS